MPLEALLIFISFHLNLNLHLHLHQHQHMKMTLSFAFPLLPNHPPLSRTTPRCSHSPPSPLRRSILLSLSLLPLLPVQAATPTLSDHVAPVIMCRRLLPSLSRYISEGSWNKGRTNVNYCTRILALRRNMKDAASFLVGDPYYDALDISAELSIVMTQLDASLYTPLFIPADEGVSLEQRKYQTEANDYYEQALQYIDTFLTLIPSSDLQKATLKAANSSYQILVEDQ